METQFTAGGGEEGDEAEREAGAGASPPLLAGLRMEAIVRLKRPRNFGNPGGFDFEEYAARRGAAAIGYIKSARLITLLPGGGARTPALVVRRRLDHIFARLYPSPAGGLTVEGAVLRACVLGGRTGLPPESERALVASGVYHVLAVSGLQVAVLAGVLVWALSWLPVPRRAVIASACAGVALYGAVVAPSASVQRAVLMAAFTAGARLLNRRTCAVRILSLTALVLLACRPQELGDPGFQLTFSATLGLLLFSAPLSASIDARWGLSALAAASLAAQAATWPLVALWFHRIVPYGLAANLLAVPLGSAAVILGLALLPADLVGGACSGAVGSLAALCVKGMLAVASVPVGGTPLSFRIAEPSTTPLLGAAASLLLLAAARGPRARVAGLVLMALSLAAAAAGPRRPACAAPAPEAGERGVPSLPGREAPGRRPPRRRGSRSRST